MLRTQAELISAPLRSVLRIVAAVLVLGLLAVIFAPYVVKVYLHAERRVALALNDPGIPGQSGLIYVESPEVYTRQRLVNDRYLQDAWLHDRLEDIDDPEAVWIDTAHIDRRLARLTLNAGAALGAADGADDAGGDARDVNGAALPQELRTLAAAIPYETRFRLQSQARDKIRQQILENALDDRHDLSGNTIFGLKFDTSILPGSATRLSPTVVVQMAPTPLDNLLASRSDPEDPSSRSRLAPEEFVRFFMRFDSDDTWDLSPEHRKILTDIDNYFNDWRQNVECRLDEYRRGEKIAKCPPAFLDQPLCDGGNLAKINLQTLLSSVKALDSSLEYVTRLSGFNIRIGSRFGEQVLANARKKCAAPDPPPTVRDFLRDDDKKSAVYPIPGVWGQLFEANPEYRLRETLGSCDIEINLTLLERDLAVYFFPGRVVGLGSGLSPISCEDCLLYGGSPSDGFSVMVEPRDGRPGTIDRLEQVLTPSTLINLRRALPESLASYEQCYVAPNDGGMGVWFEKKVEAAANDELAEIDIKCREGRLVQFRLGAFEFFRRMTQVESYTYAAFPRGDVSGVVTEAGSDQRLDAGLSAPGADAGMSLGRSQTTRSFQARPSLINFASGQSRVQGERPELFDFGWTIVKDGPKVPMMASQLVLISVPAYLDRISLTLWKGYMDVDQAPLDRSAFNELPLRQRIETLLPSWESRVITLNVPPDFAALDSIVIGRNQIFGPKINVRDLKGSEIKGGEDGSDADFRPGCHTPAPDGSLAMVIPGERLWRSTVVTLGDRKADRIEVLPDMRGVLATFEPTEVQCVESGDCQRKLPAPPFHNGVSEPVPRQLMVWTSESNDTAWIRTCDRPSSAVLSPDVTDNGDKSSAAATPVPDKEPAGVPEDAGVVASP
ncbi:MAG TPA: hypothetical protein VIN05_01895 [Roseovarius sp.]